MIGIIAAMQEEVVDIVSMMNDVEKRIIHETEFYVGTLSNKEVVVVRSGVAKINAVVSTMLCLTNFPIDCVINIGSAGGLKEGMKLLDVVVSTEVAQHDLDVGNERGKLSGQPRFVEGDATLIAKAKEAASTLKDIHVHEGLIVSGEQFITANATGEIMEHFPNVACVEMEAAAVGFTCYRMGVPFVVIRSVSDIPHNEGNGMTFEEYLPLAARNAARLTKCVVEKI